MLPFKRIPSFSLFPKHFASEELAFLDGQEASRLDREFTESLAKAHNCSLLSPVWKANTTSDPGDIPSQQSRFPFEEGSWAPAAGTRWRAAAQ